MRLRTFESLRYRNYRLYWLGSVSEHFGEFMELAAILWITNEITRSPFLLTLVASCRFMPVVLLSVVGGLAADRSNRRDLLIGALFGSVLLSVCLAVLSASARLTVWYLVVISCLHGVLMSFNHPVRQSILPNLVEKEGLLNAISLETGSVIASQAIAMPLAGYLIATVGAPPVFGLRGALAILTIWWIIPLRGVSVAAKPKERSLAHDLAEGISYVREHLVIFVLVLLFLVPRVSTNTYVSLIPIFAVDFLRVGPAGYGLLQGAAGWGSLVGFIVLASLGKLRPKGLLLLCISIVVGLSLGGFATSRWLSLSLIFLFLVGGFNTSFIILNSTLIQSMTPDRIRGRIMSLTEVIRGLGPAGSLLFGVIGEHAGAPSAILALAAICFFVSLGLILLSPRVRDIG